MRRTSGHRHVVGLRIGSTRLAAAHVVENGRTELRQLASTPLERGLVAAGEVRDADALAAALRRFFAEQRLPRRDVRLGIASSRLGVRTLEVPALDDPKQFGNAIRFRAQELLPIPVVDAVLDHVVLGDLRPENGGEPLRRVLLVFAHRDLVGRYVEVCRSAGIRLAGIDLDAFALLRAVASASAPGQATVAVAVGHERTILAVSDGSVCALTRVLEWGGSALDVALARALDLAPSQAEPVKRALSLERDEPPPGLSELQHEAARAAVRGEIGVLGRELVSSLRFYQSRPESLPVGEVLLAGGGARLDGFAAEVERLLGAPVRLADPLAGVALGKKISPPEDAGSLAIAVGLGIGA